MIGPHRRFNPLLEEWVLCSPQRLRRPWEGGLEARAETALPAHDPECYLCPRNSRADGQRNPDYTGTYAFDNDFPALVPGSGDEPMDEGELLVARPSRGVCRVLCFSPRHDLTLGGMDRRAIRLVVDAWAEEVSTLGGRDFISYVQVFENKGSMMGCSNPHPHCQVWATGHLPQIPARKTAAQQSYFETRGRDLLGDYLERELSRKERLVWENDHWVLLVPFWAVWPFETLLLPRRRVPDLPSLLPSERDALAEALKELNRRYDALFETSFPYSMGWHGRPTDGGEHPSWRLHGVYFPPLLRSATVRKFLVGYEMTAEPQRDLTPEEAAERLRGV
jgi:UDPglucose--hexose-1-phosphate uridylyltransferase